MIPFLMFAGRPSTDFGIHISGSALYKAPERNYEKYEVPGRNGDLLIDLGSFKNINVSYPAFIEDNMPDMIDAFFNFAGSQIGYQRLEDTYHPDEFRMAHYAGGIEVESSGYMNREGEFTIIFDCKPQRFLKSGEIALAFSAAGSISNPTAFPSQPLIRVYGTGSGTVSIGSYTITLTNMDAYVDIDCELMDAYKGNTNMNGNTSFSSDNIFLKPGSNGVSFTGSVTSVEITPRWYKL